MPNRIDAEAHHVVAATGHLDPPHPFETSDGDHYLATAVRGRYVASDQGPPRLFLEVLATRAAGDDEGVDVELGFDTGHQPVADLITAGAPELLRAMGDLGMPAKLALSPTWFERRQFAWDSQREMTEARRRNVFAEWACRAHGLEVCCARDSQVVKDALRWEERMTEVGGSFWTGLGLLGRMWVAAQQVWADVHFGRSEQRAAAEALAARPTTAQEATP